MLRRLARSCYQRRRRVLVAWLLLVIVVTGVSKVSGGKDATNLSLPGTESQRAFDLLKADFPSQSGDTADIVFKATGPLGVRAPAVETRMEAAYRAGEAHRRGAERNPGVGYAAWRRGGARGYR